MVTSFPTSARTLVAGPMPRKTWIGLIIVPVLIVGLLTWAFWSPDGNHDTATAAVVNKDEPVTIDGRLIPLGRQLAGNLSHSADSPYTWVLTDATDAADGLATGRYAATVTIPADFSARATSAATGKPLDAARAEVLVETSDAAAVADPALTTRVTGATQQTLDNQVVETYLDNVYIGFTTIHQKIGEAVDGAGQLAAGTTQLRDAARRLSDGADQLAAGTADLAAGSSKLAGGLSQAERDTAQLPALTRQLAAGADQVADGNEELAGVMIPLANRIIAAIDALPSASAAASEFRQFAAECVTNGGEAEFCAELTAAADRFAAEADKIDSGKGRIRAAAVSTRDSIRALASGARQVADGSADLAREMPALTAGIATAAAGARTLDDGVRKADAGAQELAGGARRLGAGAGDVDGGAQRLADQLAAGADEVPTYTDAERAHLKTVAADPSTASTRSTPVSTLIITLVVAVALWAVALATYIVTPAVPDRVLTAREPTWRMILHAAQPGATVAAVAALASTAIAAPVLGLGVVRTLGFLAVALLAAQAFVALNQSATAILGQQGRHASLVVLVLTVATGVVSTLPGPLYSLTDYLPTHAAVLALRAMATGSPGLLSGVTQLTTWLAIGVLATIFITDRRRYLSPRQLRLASAAR